MNRLWRLLTIVMLISLSLMLASCGGNNQKSSEQKSSGSDGDKVTIKAFSAFAQNNTFNEGLWMLQEKVKEKSGGRLEIVWGGGPEAIPTFQLAEAIKSGMADLALTAHTFNVSHIPIVEAAKLSQLTGAEERESGAFDFYDKLYQEKLNAHYLGKASPGLTYNLYMNVPINSTSDFKGKTIRVTPAYQAFVDALGAATVTTDPGEVYTALERKVVEGYGWPSIGIKDFGWEEVTEYVIDPPFYQVDCIILVSNKTWDKLPDDLKKVLTEAMQEVEVEALEFYKQEFEKDRKIIQERGVEVIQLPEEEAQKYLDLAYNSNWEKITEKAPDLAPKLRELISKK